MMIHRFGIGSRRKRGEANESKMSPKELEEWYQILMETDLFENESPSKELTESSGLRLKLTSFLIYPTNRFAVPRNKRRAYNDWRTQTRIHPSKTKIQRVVTFEEVFDSVPDKIRLQLMYHLDLFT